MEPTTTTTIPDKKQAQFQALFENYIDNLQNSTINKREFRLLFPKFKENL
jgi:hypothetical protein